MKAAALALPIALTPKQRRLLNQAAGETNVTPAEFARMAAMFCADLTLRRRPNIYPLSAAKS